MSLASVFRFPLSMRKNFLIWCTRHWIKHPKVQCFRVGISRGVKYKYIMSAEVSLLWSKGLLFFKRGCNFRFSSSCSVSRHFRFVFGIAHHSPPLIGEYYMLPLFSISLCNVQINVEVTRGEENLLNRGKSKVFSFLTPALAYAIPFTCTHYRPHAPTQPPSHSHSYPKTPTITRPPPS